jgi:hypothetical protein
MNINQIIRKLKKLNYEIIYCDGSLIKIYPENKELPFYSCHLGEKAIHPLRRFAKKNWNLDIMNM